MSDAAPLEYQSPLTPGAEPEPPKGALGIIFLIVFLDLMGFGIIIPLLPRYVPDYEHNPMKVTLLFSVYSICQFIGAPILGLISDRFGRRPVLAVSQVGSAFGYVLLAVATHSPGLTLLLVYLSRIIDGFTGGNISTAQAYVSDVTTPANRAKGMGVLGAAFGIGFSAGPAIGGILGHWNVAYPAFLAAAFSLLAAILSWTRLPESRKHTPADAEVWLHPSRFAPVLRNGVLVQLLMISFMIMAAFVMMESTVVLFLDGHFHFGTWETGWYFAFIGFVIIVVQGGLIGRLTKRAGEWPLALLGPVFVAIGMCLYTSTAWHPALAVLLMAGAVNAVGRSLQQPTMSSLISKFSRRDEQGVVFGLYHGLGSLARVVGPLIAGLAYPHLRNAGQFVTAGVIAVAMAVWTAALWKTAGKPVSQDATAAPETAAATPEPT